MYRERSGSCYNVAHEQVSLSESLTSMRCFILACCCSSSLLLMVSQKLNKTKPD